MGIVFLVITGCCVVERHTAIDSATPKSPPSSSRSARRVPRALVRFVSLAGISGTRREEERRRKRREKKKRGKSGRESDEYRPTTWIKENDRARTGLSSFFLSFPKVSRALLWDTVSIPLRVSLRFAEACEASHRRLLRLAVARKLSGFVKISLSRGRLAPGARFSQAFLPLFFGRVRCAHACAHTRYLRIVYVCLMYCTRYFSEDFTRTSDDRVDSTNKSYVTRLDEFSMTDRILRANDAFARDDPLIIMVTKGQLSPLLFFFLFPFLFSFPSCAYE